MQTQKVFTTATQLQDTLEAACKQTQCAKVRIFEFDKSYEDYSISYTLKGMPIANFIVDNDEESIILKKRAKNSTRHVKFAKGTLCIVEYVKKHVPYLAIKIQGDVFYTDGTHRYRK